MFFCLVLGQEAKTQGQYILFVDGTVKEGKTKLEGSTITVFEDGKKSGSSKTNSSGKFGFDLKMDHQYILEFSKVGYVSKKISVNTKGIPAGGSGIWF